MSTSSITNDELYKRFHGNSSSGIRRIMIAYRMNRTHMEHMEHNEHMGHAYKFSEEKNEKIWVY